MLARKDILPEAGLTPGAELLAEGRRLARDWRVGSCAFLEATGAVSELAYKRRQMAAGRIMQHAQVGFRDPAKSRRACAEIFEACAAEGVTLDRYGLCLDWSMRYPRELRAKRPKGTGMILAGPEDFAALSAAAPVAPHFGDFVLGFPAALENTQAALAAGATSIGNLGQFFTFRLPHWDDEVATTAATVTALGLIAGQEAEVLVHSNLDDGFAATLSDLASALGAALIEKYIVEELIGGRVSHCYGHHFSEPVTRLAFQIALARANPTPGTMVYGNTTSYRGDAAANYASLASYLLVDVLAQARNPSGHAVNPVPVSENRRIPEVDEIVDAQLFADRLIAQAADHGPLLDPAEAEALAERLLAGGQTFRDRTLAGLAEAGSRTAGNAVEVHNLTYHEACIFADGEERLLHFDIPTDFSADEATLNSVESTSNADSPWQSHIRATLRNIVPKPLVKADLAARLVAYGSDLRPGRADRLSGSVEKPGGTDRRTISGRLRTSRGPSSPHDPRRDGNDGRSRSSAQRLRPHRGADGFRLWRGEHA